MFNVTVLKMKDIKKYLLGILATSIVVFIVSKYIPKNNSMLGCLKQTVPTITNLNRTDEQRNYEDDFLQGILKTQISSMKVIENMENNMGSNIENEDVKENEVEEEQKQNI